MKRAPGEVMLREAGSVGLATLLSRILGLVREQVIAALFGAGNATDAFNVAFRIPNLLRNLFAEGAMSAALVPVFTRARHEEGDVRAWRVAGLAMRALVVFVAILTVFGIFFAEDLGRVYASAYQDVPGKLELTVRMTRMMFPYFPLVTLAAVFVAVLNASGQFFFPALSSAFFNLGSVLTGVLLAKLISGGHGLGFGVGLGLQPIEGMAIGVIFGGLAQAFCLLPLLYRVGYRFPKRIDFPVWHQDPALRRMLALLLPGIAGLAATQVSVLINTILATSQGPGAVSWLNYAFRLMQFPIGLFGASIATAMLPVFSRQWVSGDRRTANETLSSALCHGFAINLPAAAGLAFLSYPIIELIFQHGRFQSSDTLATSLALAMYAIGLPAYSAVKILVPVCYAMGNSKLPVIASAASVLLGLVLNLILMNLMGFSGLALGTSLAALLNFGFLVCAVQKLLLENGSSLELDRILRSFSKNLAASLAMGAAVYLSWTFLESAFPGDGAVLRLIRTVFLISEGLFIVLMLARVFHLQEIQGAASLIVNQLRGHIGPKKIRLFGKQI